MRFKTSLKNIIMPVLASNGFSILEKDSTYAYYQFTAEDDTLRIVIDKAPGFPELRVKLLYRDYTSRFSSFPIERLYEYTDVDLCYDTQEELDSIFKLVADSLGTKVIQHMRLMRDNHVYPTERIRESYDKEPEIMAAKYACKNSRFISHDLSNFIFTEKRINEMRSTDMSQWRTEFDNHTNEIIELIAFYGENLRSIDPLNIRWELGQNGYILENYPGDGFPQHSIIGYWNSELFLKSTLVPLKPSVNLEYFDEYSKWLDGVRQKQKANGRYEIAYPNRALRHSTVKLDKRELIELLGTEPKYDPYDYFI